MNEPNQLMWCSTCGKLKVMTAGGGVLCPDHGGVLSNTDITARSLKTAERDRERFRWLSKFDQGKRRSRRTCELEDGTVWVFLVPEGSKTSQVPWLMAIPEWMEGTRFTRIIAVDDVARYAIRMEYGSEPPRVTERRGTQEAPF